MRMKQNEQSLMLKEQELQQLLEELYIQEIYADNALETAIVNTTPNRPTTPSGNLLNMSTFKMHSPNSINNLLNSSQNKQALSAANNNVVHLHHADLHNESSHQNETIDSFENGHNNNEANLTHDRERMVELIINERNSFNNSNIDFMQQQQKQLTMENAFDQQTKRQIRMYNENDNQILMNSTNPMDSNQQSQQQTNSIKIQQQVQKVAYTGSGQLGSQHKSLSFGNLANQQTNGHTNSTHNLNHITSPSQHTKQPKQPNMNISSHRQQHYVNGNSNHEANGNDTNQSHSMSMSMKNLKINQSNQFISHHGPNGDHSGGDNDSGISSMSSETAAALNNANIVPNSFGYLQKQHQPIIMGQRFNNNGHLTQQSWQQQQQQQQQPFIQNQSQRQPVYHSNHLNGSSLNINQSPVNTSVANTSVSKAVLETLV